MTLSYHEEFLLLVTTPLYTIVICAEILLSNFRAKGYYSVKETITNVYLSLLNAGIDLLFRSVYMVIFIALFRYRIIDTWSSSAIYWFALFILEDLAYYFEHRVDHYCRLFWAVHVTHHSSEEFNLTTGFRSSVLQPLYRFIYFLPLIWLGFKPFDILFMFSITQIYGILVHTQFIKKMPSWFELFFVSPSHHRVHHASNVEYLDKNMGMVLIIWDKIFGTFQKEMEEIPVKYGLTKNVETPHHPIRIVTHEWENIAKDLTKNVSIKDKLKYLLMPPGWSHDGSTKTAKELRRALKSK